MVNHPPDPLGQTGYSSGKTLATERAAVREIQFVTGSHKQATRKGRNKLNSLGHRESARTVHGYCGSKRHACDRNLRRTGKTIIVLGTNFLQEKVPNVALTAVFLGEASPKNNSMMKREAYAVCYAAALGMSLIHPDLCY